MSDLPTRPALPPLTDTASPALSVVYQDAHLLVLDKPAGLLSVPGRGPDKQDCLSARASARYPDALIVHRLDMATSGLLLMARGVTLQRQLSAAFAARQVHKRYEALVDGVLPASEIWSEIDAPIAADWPRRPLRVIDPSGQPSLTRWRVLAPLPTLGASRLLLEPVTGRTHQLRVHLLLIGHPILGDMLYATEPVQQRAKRLMLHATELALTHPVTGEPLHFTSASGF